MIDAAHWANYHDVRVWMPRLYQSNMGGKPFEQWAPCYYSGGWDDGHPRLCMNMDDIGPDWTLERARAESVRRNTLQVHNARRRVEKLEKELAVAREVLVRVETALAQPQQ